LSLTANFEHQHTDKLALERGNARRPFATTNANALSELDAVAQMTKSVQAGEGACLVEKKGKTTEQLEQ